MELTVPYTAWRFTTAYPEDVTAKARQLKATTDAEGHWTLDGVPVDQIEYEKYPSPREPMPEFEMMTRRTPRSIESIQPRRLFLSHPAYKMTPVEIELKQLLPDSMGKFEYVFAMEMKNEK